MDSIVEKLNLGSKAQQNLEVCDYITVFEVSVGESVPVEKVNEPFDVIRKTYNNSINEDSKKIVGVS